MPQRRFSAVPIIASILKTMAVLILLFELYQVVNAFISTIQSWKGGTSMYGQLTPPITEFGKRLDSLMRPIGNLFQAPILPLISWAFAEVMLALREIEFNVRKPEPVYEAPAANFAPYTPPPAPAAIASAPAPKDAAE
jgi:hypothetical protein